MSRVTIDKIKITVGGKTLELSPAELKELRDVLDETFPKFTFSPSHPIVIERPVYPTRPWGHWEVTCGDTVSGTDRYTAQPYTLSISAVSSQ